MTGYNKIKPNKYKAGGFISNPMQAGDAVYEGIGQVTDTIDSLVNPNGTNKFMGGASGALKGSKYGVVGALVGGVAGFIGAQKKERELERQKAEQIASNVKQEREISQQTLSNYDTNGTQGVQYYSKGGRILVSKYPGGGKLPTGTPSTIPYMDRGTIKLDSAAFAGGKLMVEKRDGRIAEWGNDIKETKFVLPPELVVPQGQTNPDLTRSGHKYQGTPTNAQIIAEKEKQLKAASMGSRVQRFAMGGRPVKTYEVEEGEVVQGNAQLEDSTPIANDLQRVDGQKHSEGGVKGVGGDRVFSDNIKIGEDLSTVLNQLKISTTKPSMTYGKAAELIGKRKGKMEEKMGSHFVPSVNTAKRTLGRLDSSLDLLFESQEAGKQTSPTETFRDGGIPYKSEVEPYSYGNVLDGIMNPEIQPVSSIGATNTTGGISNGTVSESNFTAPIISEGEGGDFLSKLGGFAKDNEGQILNGLSYMGNLASIRKLDTSVKRRYIDTPRYNYTDRSGLAKSENQASFNTAVKSLGTTSQGVNASNAGALYGQTLNANNQIANQEGIRKDNYDANFGQRSDRVNAANSDIYNQASDQERELRNYKNVEAPLAARNTFMQGYAGNRAVKDQKNLDNKKALLNSAVADDNGALTRFAKKMGFKDLNDFITNYISK